MSSRKERIKRIICFFLAINLFFEVISPTVALALTSGPAQQEFSSFEPSATTDMVDLNTGDFTYNIPLMSVPGPNGGYPINIAYHSGVGMEQEASWVGLGWTLNVGSINRQLRGLPDDFKGDQIKKRQHMKDSWMVALDIPKKIYREAFGFPPPNLGSSLLGSSTHIQVYYNNYKGLGYRYSANFTFPNKGIGENAAIGLNASFDSQNGIEMEPKLTLSSAIGKAGHRAGFDLGFSFNSRQGIYAFNSGYSINLPAKKHQDFKTKYGLVRYKSPFKGGSASLSFGNNLSVPKVSVPTKVTTVPFNLKIAKPSKMGIPSKFQSKFPLLWSGYVSTTKLVDKGKMSLNSFGYDFDYKVHNNNESYLRDFQRGDIAYSKKVPNLSSSAFTYDIYNQTGQGTGSMFRSYQNKISVLYDPEVISKESSYDGEIEFGMGPGSLQVFNPLNLHVGVGFNYGHGENRSGYWKSINASDIDSNIENLRDTTLKPASPLFENTYLKVYGEKTGFYSESSDDQLNLYGGDRALKLKVEKVNNDATFLNRHHKVLNELIENEGGANVKSLNSSSDAYRNTNAREKKVNNIEKFTVAQAQEFGHSSNLTYKVGTNNVSKFSTSRPAHHTSEISMLQPDGMRYVYGLATYNNIQVDNVFTLKNTSASNSFNTNTVSIATSNSGIEGIDIEGTKEEYMSRNEIPGYANNFLLTYIFSSDYVDLTNNGPSDDDYGYWMKFNYEKVHDDFKWRAPYSGANFVEGLKSETYDDKGSYTYGTKEIFIIESIESKTHIAKFITSDRQDCLEASSELSNNAQGTKKMRKLDKIILYSKNDLNSPIKTANFVYSYELCLGIPNNTGSIDNTNDWYDMNGNPVSGSQSINQGINGKYGKLTLKQVYFTYQNSNRSQLSPYVFNYNTPNPDYDRRNMDRWGNYVNNVGSGGMYSTQNNPYPYIDFPYTNQDYPNVVPTAPWTLSQIVLPTGGVLNVEYEKDDYRYVEKERALRMFDITGFDSNQPFASRNLSNNVANADNHRIYFKLEKPYNVSTPNLLQKYINEYLNYLPKGQVYFKVDAKLYNYNLDPTIHDYVSGYGEIDIPNCGLDAPDGNGNINFAYIQLKKVALSKLNVSNTQINPIAKSIIEHMRLNRSELLYNSVPNSNSAQAQIANLLSSTFSLFSQIKAAVVGFNKYMYESKFNKNFTVHLNGRSIIRLCDPDDKIGGGVRVKRLAINDNWTNGNNADNMEYGQNYEYKTVDEFGTLISSGVAYEPQIGYEECALRTALKFASSSWTHSDYPTFIETPVASMHYPGENISYSKVTVRSIGTEIAANNTSNTNILKSNAAPITVYEFYTPKDFPVIFKQTDQGPYAKPIYIPIPILGLFSTIKRRHTRTQGYSVVLNDMAGKQKQITSYTTKNSIIANNLISVPDKVISMKKFIYGTKNPYNPNAINELDNRVQTITVDNNYNNVYQTAVLGQSHDMYMDMNENSQFHEAFGATGNLDFSIFTFPPLFIPIPVFVPWVLPSYHKTTNSLRTVVYNKVIHRSGILIKTETTEDKSTIVEECLAFDIESGNPLLTKVTNEFKDPIYSFNFPAHWYYKNVGGAYKNFGLINVLPPNTTVSQGNLPVGSANTYFTKGDLVYVDVNTNNNYDGVYHVYSVNGTHVRLVNPNGIILPNGEVVRSLQVVKSGYKNQQNVNVGALTFKQTGFVPLDYSDITNTKKLSPQSISFTNPNQNKILNASALELSDNWQMACSGDPVGSGGGPNCNCPPSISAFDLVNFLKSMSQAGKLYNANELVFNNGTPVGNNYPINSYPGTYSYNFTQNLILNNPSLIFDLGGVSSNGQPVKYTGGISPSDNSFVFFLKSNFTFPSNNPDQNCGLNPRTCAVKFIVPQNLIIGNYQDFWNAVFASNISIMNSTSCNQSGLSLSVTLPNYGTFELQANVVPCNPQYNIYPCQSFYNCASGNPGGPNSCAVSVGTAVNPYQIGMKGIWRPKYSYLYKTDRTQNNNIREDGIFTNFNRFPWENPVTKDDKWIKSNTVTKYIPQGFEVENVNPIGNFSSALYGYENALVTAVASNARYTDIAFDGFEDYPKACDQDHFSFSQYSANVVNTEAHTGKHSILIGFENQVTTFRKVFTNCDANTVNGVPYVNDNINQTPLMVGSDNVSHIIKPCDCIGKFAPQITKKYLVSAWVKEKINPSETKPLETYIGTQVIVSFYSGNTLISSQFFTPSGNIIDGWQRIIGEFNLPPNTTDVQVTLNYIGTLKTYEAYVDDVRLMPVDGNMKSYVYDAKSLKILAELDENNYATMYNYDDEGNLTKVKKETEKGIKTVKEGRINSKKLDN